MRPASCRPRSEPISTRTFKDAPGAAPHSKSYRALRRLTRQISEAEAAAPDAPESLVAAILARKAAVGTGSDR